MSSLKIVGSDLDHDDVYGSVLDSDIAVRNYLAPFKKHLSQAGATELWVNKPGEVILEVGTEHRFIAEPILTYEFLTAFATAVAVYSPQQQQVGPDKPLLSATLPDGERIQLCLPPVVEPGTVALSIRIPSSSIFPLSSYREGGAFDKFVWARPRDLVEGSPADQAVAQVQETLKTHSDSAKLMALSPEDRELALCLTRGDLHEFLVKAIAARKNIGIVGDTGSGKTALMKALCQIIPKSERLISIEDVRELYLPQHPNRVHLLYAKDGQGLAKITPADLISCCMRMAPSRVLLAELRGSEAWDFLKLLTTGHSGSITSWHAQSCGLAFERFMFLAKENNEAASLSRDEIKKLASMTIDVVMHIWREPLQGDDGGPGIFKRVVDQVHFDPWAKNEAQFGHDMVI